MNTRFGRRVSVVATLGLLTLTALAPASVAASSAPRAQAVVAAPAATYCTTNATRVVLFTVTKGAKLTYIPENVYVGAHVTLSNTITSSTTYKASVTLTAGVKAEAGVIFAQAEASAGIQLMAEGATTTTVSKTITVTNPGSTTKQYVFFGGTRTVSGEWQYQKCKYDALAGHNNWYSIGNGTYKSWEKMTWGAIPCTDTPASGTVPKLAIAYCD
jgi:hypothetical protein